MLKLLLIPAMLAAALTVAAPAYAGEEEFLTDLANNNFTGPTDVALTMGYQICTDIAHSVPEATTVEAIYQNTADEVTYEDAQFIYDAAFIYLC
ncbi:DUF732 domain-containing protein [Mycolicibacterium tokaiense]|uniref:Protein of uncharacterized function (DUF732) n=1 Tax=Mycolicibacterium tokaiense TaxID=39695 RepID=A0A378TAA7_9MYCO|nr:DUF732 domain-containing protein [Mycolicibacterium tokaiense]BBY87755.1 hypothetical protein MTOK_35370 [Mycolicibacterium tokaiense]STZ57721.1 Protein of uncharacterised function (DUF732) [Mycolicibacterium tokaiense]